MLYKKLGEIQRKPVFFFDRAVSDPYYCALMSKAPYHKVLPRGIDPRKFAQQGIEIAGDVPVAELARLVETLADSRSNVAVTLDFGVNEEGHKVLHGTADAQVQVICQRCLEPMPLPLSSELALGIVWTEEQAVALPKSLDPLIAPEGAIDIYEVIEEELLLSLPMTPYHDHDCIDPALMSSSDKTVEAEADTTNNPFKVLEQLKGSPKS